MKEINPDSVKPFVYQIIISDLKAQIDKNNFSFEKPFCTETQLMERYNTSRITAKRAISELEHEGIIYRKKGVGSFVSRSIFSKTADVVSSNKTIGLVLPFEISNGGLFATVTALNNILSKNGHFMCIYITDKNHSKEKVVLKQLSEQNLSGLVFYPISNDFHLDLLNYFVMKNIPVVIIDKSSDCKYINTVCSDNYSGGILLTEHLLSLGHKNIAYFSSFNIESLSTIRDRFSGYMYALKQAGITPNPNFVVTDVHEHYKIQEKSNEDDTYRTILQNLIRMGVTAIEAENDEVAFSIMLSCKELNINIPGDLSICGFDNSEFSHMRAPGITTIKQNFEQFGISTADIIMSNIESYKIEPAKVIIPVELVVRESTGKPRQ